MIAPLVLDPLPKTLGMDLPLIMAHTAGHKDCRTNERGQRDGEQRGGNTSSNAGQGRREPNGKQEKNPKLGKVDHVPLGIIVRSKKGTEETEKEEHQPNKERPDPQNEGIDAVLVHTDTGLVASILKNDFMSIRGEASLLWIVLAGAFGICFQIGLTTRRFGACNASNFVPFILVSQERPDEPNDAREQADEEQRTGQPAHVRPRPNVGVEHILHCHQPHRS
mmetsp:Transcript_2395/g.5437  ORF Transcript_2395/g.5437 Transcript_2395/m.5437 type:complete len:222 (+) Transcript_2395:534-1199(+)